MIQLFDGSGTVTHIFPCNEL